MNMKAICKKFKKASKDYKQLQQEMKEKKKVRVYLDITQQKLTKSQKKELLKQVVETEGYVDFKIALFAETNIEFKQQQIDYGYSNWFEIKKVDKIA